VLSVEDWAEIRRLARAEGLSVKAIVRRTGISRNAVRRALASDGPPRYSRPSRGGVFDTVEPRVCALLRTDPGMPATVIAERIRWAHSVRLLRMRVRELRPLFLPADPASRTTYDPGELAQCDLWFPPVDLPLGAGQVGRPPVLVMVSGYSRWIEAVLLPSRQGPDLLAGHWRLLHRIGAVPRALVWDNEPAVGSWRAGRPQLTQLFAEFAGTLGISVVQCRPKDPESKGLVERVNGYLETSFLPGRTFTDHGDFDRQLTDWLSIANTRRHRAIGCRPADRIDADRAVMLTLPPLSPVPALTGWSLTTRLPRDHYVRLASNDYSVHPCAVGRIVQVHADLNTVRVTCDAFSGRQVVAEHARCWARHQTITDPEHRAAAERMRQAHRALPRPPHRSPDEPESTPDKVGRNVEVVTRPLTDYDLVLDGAQPGQVAS
jgi:transposase